MYMNVLVYSSLELQCSLALIIGATAAFCCNQKTKIALRLLWFSQFSAIRHDSWKEGYKDLSLVFPLVRI